MRTNRVDRSGWCRAKRAMIVAAVGCWAMPLMATAQSCEPEWLALGSGVDGVASPFPVVWALAIFDDGSGPALYAGGNFTEAGGNPAERIARWDGSEWTPLGAGANGIIYAMTVFDDGSGPALYAGGDFTAAGGSQANRIARWDGSAWTPLGDGMERRIRTLAVFDDGTGPALYAGGTFTTAGGVDANRVARWDGAAWSALGEGVRGGSVGALAVFDDGTGPALYAGGLFDEAGGAPAGFIAQWDGSAWSTVGTGMNDSVRALAVYNDGAGPALYAGGDFSVAGGTAASQAARWDGSAWSPLGLGVSGGRVAALAVFDDGTGPALYLGGNISQAGGQPARFVARWDGTAWSTLDEGVFGTVNDLAAFNDAVGRALYVAGAFTQAGGVAANRIARWGRPCSTPPCHADLDGDGELTLFDFLAFQNAFHAGDPVADFDGDGELTIFDFLAFQNEFDAGCD